MAEGRNIRFVDRLKDRGFIDQWGFIFFAVSGFAGIIIAKWFGLGTLEVSAVAVFVMLLYAIVIARSGTGRVRADQAGDNCYYLGLIYTLASLSFVIATFDPTDNATAIVQGFGVALATTIFGLILRVFFNQGRPDLENVEEQARLDLTNATSRLKGELNNVVVQMNDFSRQLRQSMQEMHDAATEGMTKFTTTSVKGLEEVVQTANKAIRDEANDFAQRSQRYTTTFDNLLSKLDGHAETLDKISASHQAMSGVAQLAKDASESASSSVTSLGKQAAEVAGVVSMLQSNGEATRALMEQLLATVSSVATTFESIHSETEAQLETLKAGPSEVIERTLTALGEASSQLQTNVAQVSQLHSQVTDDLARQANSAIATSKAHNIALEAELSKSRELASKVHSALSDMTEALASELEARS